MCQRLVCQKREFAARSSSVKFNDPKLKNEVFVSYIKTNIMYMFVEIS